MLNFIDKRVSVRDFLQEQVPIEDIKKIIEAAIKAPSATNRQNWHFVIVRDKNKIDNMAKIVVDKNAKISEMIEDKEMRLKFKSMLNYHTIFKKAPTVILLYTTHYQNVISDLYDKGKIESSEYEKIKRVNPSLQNISAAMQNLLLAAANLGYGACWMTGPAYAADELTKYIGFNKEGYYWTSMTPIGYPAHDNIKSPQRKNIEEVITLIE